MSKTPEQYVEYALKHFSEHHKTAGRIVQELRAAGWLREANEIPALVALEGYKRLLAEKERELCPGCYDRVTELTRERDEARVDREAWARAYRRALASAASPEVLRVVEEAVAYSEHWHKTFRRIQAAPKFARLLAAVDALSASLQPKAQEPKYEAVASSGGWQEGGMVRSTKTQELVFGSWRGGESAAFHKARCEVECARLNGEGGAS